MKQFKFTIIVSDQNAGFTIIEALVALAIFSIGILAMSALQNSSLMKTYQVEETTEALEVLNDQVDALKAVPFYANKNGLDDDGDAGTYNPNDPDNIDEIDEELPEMVANALAPAPGFLGPLTATLSASTPIPAGNPLIHNVLRRNGLYTVHWQVVNDTPVPAVTMPQPTSSDPIISGPAGPAVPAGTYTVSKTIYVQVTKGNHMGENPPLDPFAMTYFVKTWVESGQLPYR